MLIVRATLKIDVLKMEDTFFTSYQEGENVFYLFSHNKKGEE
jgi:hypothetical protein